MTPTPDHQMPPQHDTSTPTEDHQSTSTTKITEPIRPLHHDPTVIDFDADAPRLEINCTGPAGPVRSVLASADVSAAQGGPRSC